MCVVSPPRHETRRSVDALEMCRGSAQRGTRVTRAIQGAIMCEPQRTELEKHQTFFQWEFIFVLRHYVRMWFTSCMIVGLDR